MPKLVPEGTTPQFVSGGRGRARKMNWSLYTDGIQRIFDAEDWDNGNNKNHWSINMLQSLHTFCAKYNFVPTIGWDLDAEGNKTALYLTITPAIAVLQDEAGADPRTFRSLDRGQVRQITTLD